MPSLNPHTPATTHKSTKTARNSNLSPIHPKQLMIHQPNTPIHTKDASYNSPDRPIDRSSDTTSSSHQGYVSFHPDSVHLHFDNQAISNTNPHTLINSDSLSFPHPNGDHGTSLAIRVFDHISGSLPQWLSTEPIPIDVPTIGDISMREIRASARKPHPQVHIELISSHQDLAAWGYKRHPVGNSNDRAGGAWHTSEPSEP